MGVILVAIRSDRTLDVGARLHYSGGAGALGWDGLAWRAKGLAYLPMNTQLIRERLNRDTGPFVLRLSDGTRVPASHPDFVAVSPGQVVVIDAKTEGITRIDPLHVVAIEEMRQKSKSRSKGSR